MKWFTPDYYDSFACIKGECRHSCCVGWEIDIDEDTLAFYRTLSGSIAQRLKESIDESGESPCFRLGEGERCPFLNNSGLCDLILECGEDSLCEICADHPRFRNFFSDREETGLGLSCEEAARIILTHPEPVYLKLTDDHAEEAPLNEDEEHLLNLRSELIGVMQDRSLDIDGRIEKLLHKSGLILTGFHPGIWAAFLTKLERLDNAWNILLEELTVCEVQPFPAPSKAFEIALEQLMVYFLFRHLPGALEDDDLSGRIAFCIRMWQLLRALQARRPDGSFIELCRMFSAEIEYSDENIGLILEYIHKENPRL